MVASKRPRRLVWAALLLAFFLALGWILHRAQGGVELRYPEERPNVLLVSIDTLRADHLGTYGAKVPTPYIDSLAGKGVVFEWAVSHVPITLPSHASLFTGSYPIWHGVRDNGSFRLDEAHETLAETFRSAGYRTAAFVGSFALDSRFGLDQGFEHYDDFYGDASELNDFAISERSAEQVIGPALEWIRSHRDGRWFVFLHLYDPHAPYAPPPPFRDNYGADGYTAEVAYVDAALAKLGKELQEEGLLDNTLVVLTSDHGEGLGDHGESTHGMFAYESTLHVPLLFTWDGVLPGGKRISSRVRLIDVAPSIVELARLAPSVDYQGESLVPLVTASSRGEHRESYFEALAFNLNRNWAPLTGLYRGTSKFIELPIPELYDLETDRGEAQNLTGTRARTASQMRDALSELVGAHSTEESRRIETVAVDRETQERLESLGYLVASREPEEKQQYTEDDDPKRLIHLSDLFDQGVARHVAGDAEDAIRIFRAILKERPSFSNAYSNLAYVLRESGRLSEAIETLEEAVERGVHNRSMLGRLGAYLQEAGRVEESAALLEAVIAEDPTYVEAYNYLGVSYARLGRLEEAVEVLNKLLVLDSSYASGYNNLGSVYLGVERLREAEVNFRRALEIDPGLAGAWNGLGVIAARTGRQDDAIAAWKRSVELDSRQYDTLYNLGTLLTQLNRFSEAIPYLEAFSRTAPPDRYGDDIPKVKRLLTNLRAAASRGTP